jgi:hypothetical protein
MDQRNDSIFPEASRLNGTSEVGTTESTGVTAADPPTAEHAPEGVGAGIRPGFLAELAVAMRTTAEKERERISARVADDAGAHVEKVRARAAIETDELRRLAEEDVQHIEEWSVTEMDRIRSEADRKIEDRRASLDEYLKQHDSIIDTEIDGVNDAVREYDSTLDRFFKELAQADDPSTIVARAEALPAPPDLDQVRAQARARAVAMFADVEDPVAEVAQVAPAAQAAPIAEAMVEPEPMTAPSSEAMVAEATAERPEASIETVEAMATPAMEEPIRAEAMIETPPEDPAPTAQSDGAGSMADVQPIPVMDPDATADSTWPAPTPEAEPEPVAASVDHTSAAVRLLRSVAPWTAPTHPGSNDRSDSD